MNIEEYRLYCLSLPGTTEGTPFGEDVLVFKVMGKMFALFNLVNFETVNLKCDPELCIAFREQYNAVKEGYHMNKKHWNTVQVNSDVPDKLFFQMTKDSYDLVKSGLTKALKEELKELTEKR